MTPTKPSRSATCPSCGGTMSAGNGKGRDPEKCIVCTRADRAAARGGHGTLGEYSRGCRCDECRAANAEYMRDYMRRRRATAAASSRSSGRA